LRGLVSYFQVVSLWLFIELMIAHDICSKKSRKKKWFIEKYINSNLTRLIYQIIYNHVVFKERLKILVKTLEILPLYIISLPVSVHNLEEKRDCETI